MSSSTNEILSEFEKLLEKFENLSDVDKIKYMVKKLSERAHILTSIISHIPVFQFLGWDFITLAIDETAKYLKDESFSPDIVIGIGRGGAILAGLLSHKLNIPKVGVLLTSFEQGKKRKVLDVINIDVKKKQIVLIDDIMNTAETMYLTTKYCKQNGATDIKYIVLAKKIDTPDPDFFIIESNQLIFYPWDSGKRIRLSDIVIYKS